VQWQGCTGFLTSLKGCTNTKKVDNHCFRSQWTKMFRAQWTLSHFSSSHY